MHDPMTVAFEIKYPWKAYSRAERKKNPLSATYRNSFLTIWHKDPEKDGSDNSCDWFGGKRLDKDLREKVFKEADFEYETEQFFFDREGRPQTSCLEMVLGIARVLLWRVWKKSLTPKMLVYLSSLATHPVNNFNDTHRRGVTQKEDVRDLFRWIAGAILRFQRPWWRHPRWHVWHWRFQIHPLRKLSRWLFKRCYLCGKRFGWNESRVGDSNGHFHSSCKHDKATGETS